MEKSYNNMNWNGANVVTEVIFKQLSKNECSDNIDDGKYTVEFTY